jgi:hypothetical protein
VGEAEISIIILVAVVIAVPSLLAYLDLRRSGQGYKALFVAVAFVVCWPLAFVFWVYWHAHARPAELSASRR